MTEGIIIAMITGTITLIGVIISNNAHDAVTDEKIEELTRKVEKHNNLIERVYECERLLDVHEERIKVANHRIEDLENKGERAATV